MKKKIFAFLLSVFTLTGVATQTFANDLEEGSKIMLTKSKGNCVACHDFGNATQPGSMGPELIGIKKKFPTKSLLRKRVWDATRFNPISAMPPFGRNRILSEKEIDQIVAYLITL